MHRIGLRKGHRQIVSLGQSMPDVPPKPLCEMAVDDDDEVKERFLKIENVKEAKEKEKQNKINELKTNVSIQSERCSTKCSL